MDNKWLLIWLVAPIFSPGAVALEACSLFWYVHEDLSRRYICIRHVGSR